MPEQTPLGKPLAIIGEEDLVSGFRALGFSVYPVTGPEEFSKALVEALDSKPAICLVQDTVYRQQKERIDVYRSAALPVFIPFAKNGEVPLLEEMVKGIRLRATGTN